MRRQRCVEISRRYGLARSSEQRLHFGSRSGIPPQSCVEPKRFSIPFSRSYATNGTQELVAAFRTTEELFVQPSPSVDNQFEEDALLQSYLKRRLPSEHQPTVFDDLRRFGHRVSHELVALHKECEDHPPRLTQYDAWGKRIDDIWTCSAWKKMHDISAEEGLIASGYEGQFGAYSRLFQAVKNYLFSGHSGLYSCPLAMTDGACKIIKAMDRTQVGPFDKAFENMTSRDPSKFWTSGQWMTERRGGSDVANGTGTTNVSNLSSAHQSHFDKLSSAYSNVAETRAIPLSKDATGPYALYGYKWFSSATDSNMAFTLARVVDADGNIRPGTSGLSLFYVETRGKDSRLNNIEVVRMKNKLGTKQLPTAELILNGTVAYMLGDAGRGVSSISYMLFMTRLHNAIAAVSNMRKILSLARRYALQRTAFGKLLVDHPLHVRTLTDLEVEVRGSLLLLLETARLLGLEEYGLATEHQKHLLRILSPLLKLWTAKQSVGVVSEALESFGGQGYIEDTGIPGILRDTQVLPIWEGTTNILSLDVLRSVEKSQGKTAMAVLREVDNLMKSSRDADVDLDGPRDLLTESLGTIGSFLSGTDNAALNFAARDIALSLVRTYIGALLIEHAASSEQEVDIAVARRWCSKKLTFIENDYSANSAKLDKSILMDGL